MVKNRKLNRLRGYDYSKDNIYYITSCVRKMVCCFGAIQNCQMILNEIGSIAEQQWFWLGEQYLYIVLHAFVVMPNHIHGIIEINRGKMNVPQKIKPLSELIGSYKSITSKRIHLTGYTEFEWKRSFHDRINRNDESYETITKY